MSQSGARKMISRSTREEVSDTGQLRSVSELHQLLEDTLPLDEIVYAFGYGSGVLSQNHNKKGSKADGDDATDSMIDLIVVVRNAHRFHTANLQRNPHHYSLLLSKSSAAICTWVQRHQLPTNKWLRNPGLYFNVTDTIKYGVVQREEFQTDLMDWTYLYLAGRLHKPVVTIIDSDQELADLQHNKNLPAALSAALLLQWNNRQVGNASNSCCTSRSTDIYTQIAALSYTGDPRMAVQAEDPAKIQNLVQAAGQLERFARLYQPAAAKLQQEGLLSIDSDDDTWTWDSDNLLAHQRLWQSLPAAVQSSCGYNNKSGTNHVAAAAALPAVLAAIVAPAARYQSIKGIWTAGIGRSAQYAYRKLSKGLLSSSKR